MLRQGRPAPPSKQNIGASPEPSKSPLSQRHSETARRGQPLTDPAVSPSTMYFWKISTSRTAGSAPRKPEAAITE